MTRVGKNDWWLAQSSGPSLGGIESAATGVGYKVKALGRSNENERRVDRSTCWYKTGREDVAESQ